jgi:hypothetical protein
LEVWIEIISLNLEVQTRTVLYIGVQTSGWLWVFIWDLLMQSLELLVVCNNNTDSVQLFKLGYLRRSLVLKVW